MEGRTGGTTGVIGDAKGHATANGQRRKRPDCTQLLCCGRHGLDAGATDVTENMKRAAATAIAECVSAEELRPGFVIPSVFDTTVGERVAAAVAEAARADGVCRDQR